MNLNIRVSIGFVCVPELAEYIYHIQLQTRVCMCIYEYNNSICANYLQTSRSSGLYGLGLGLMQAGRSLASCSCQYKASKLDVPTYQLPENMGSLQRPLSSGLYGLRLGLMLGNKLLASQVFQSIASS